MWSHCFQMPLYFLVFWSGLMCACSSGCLGKCVECRCGWTLTNSQKTKESAVAVWGQKIGVFTHITYFDSFFFFFNEICFLKMVLNIFYLVSNIVFFLQSTFKASKLHSLQFHTEMVKRYCKLNAVIHLFIQHQTHFLLVSGPRPYAGNTGFKAGLYQSSPVSYFRIVRKIRVQQCVMH